MAVRGGERRRIGYILAPSGQAGGGMGRVKDYILQSGGDRHGRIRFGARVRYFDVCSRYSRGATPNCCLNTRLKYAGSQKPQAYATSDTLVSR